MKINSEMLYRQHLERLKAIQENLKLLAVEDKRLLDSIIEFQGTEEWLENRKLKGCHTKQILGIAMKELTSLQSFLLQTDKEESNEKDN